jgi:hypothetical protein
MKLVTVQCARPQDAEDDEPRLAITIADGAEEAEQLCRREYASDGYTRFNAKDTIDGHLPGPAHILGYTGKTPAFQLETINQLGPQRRPQPVWS